AAFFSAALGAAGSSTYMSWTPGRGEEAGDSSTAGASALRSPPRAFAGVQGTLFRASGWALAAGADDSIRTRDPLRLSTSERLEPSSSAAPRLPGSSGAGVLGRGGGPFFLLPVFENIDHFDFAFGLGPALAATSEFIPWPTPKPALPTPNPAAPAWPTPGPSSSSDS